jgi:hypothetical protein
MFEGIIDLQSCCISVDLSSLTWLPVCLWDMQSSADSH